MYSYERLRSVEHGRDNFEIASGHWMPVSGLTGRISASVATLLRNLMKLIGIVIN